MTAQSTLERFKAAVEAIPPQVTLRDLAEKALEAHRKVNDPSLPDALWNAANAAEIEARDEFQQRLFEATGLTPSLLGQLVTAGVI